MEAGSRGGDPSLVSREVRIKLSQQRILTEGGLSSIWDHYKDDTYVGTLNPSFQLSAPATGTSLRPIADLFLEHILDPKLPKNIGF